MKTSIFQPPLSGTSGFPDLSPGALKRTSGRRERAERKARRPNIKASDPGKPFLPIPLTLTTLASL